MDGTTPPAGPLAELRQRGWVVAVHNDYKLQGNLHTFWLFTKGAYCAKGEGQSDEEALAQVLVQVQEIEADEMRVVKALLRPGDSPADAESPPLGPPNPLQQPCREAPPSGESAPVAPARPELDEDAVRSAYYNNHVVQWLFGKLDTARDQLYAYQEKATDACVSIRDEYGFNTKPFNATDRCADAVYAVGKRLPAERSERAELRAEMAALKETLRCVGEEVNTARAEAGQLRHRLRQVERSHDAALRDLVAANLATVECQRELDEAWKATGSGARGMVTLAEVITTQRTGRIEAKAQLTEDLKAARAKLLEDLKEHDALIARAMGSP